MSIQKVITQVETDGQSGGSVTNISTTEINVLGGLAFSEGADIPSAQNIEGTDSNVFALIVTNLTSTNTDCFANMQWREVK